MVSIQINMTRARNGAKTRIIPMNFTVGIGTDSPHYYIRFTDGVSAEHCLEVKKDLFDLFD